MKPGKKRKHPLIQEETADRTDEAEVFRNLMKNSGVKKLKSQRDPLLTPPSAAGKNQPLEFEEASDWYPDLENISPSEKFSGLKKKISRKPVPKQKISREFIPNDTLDLHGKTKDQAISRVHRLLRVSQRNNYQSILIITGKGINSKERGGVLGKAVWEWLQYYQESHPIRFQWAPIFLGGKGAILVFF